MKLSVPNKLTDINTQWILALLLQIDKDCPATNQLQVLHFTLQIQPNNQGVLSDICKVYFAVKSEKYSVSHKWFIKIIPHQLRSLVQRHRLFEREITFYSQVMPTLLAKFNHQFQYFKLPKYIYGDVTKQGEGVLVLEDLSPFGFATSDPSTTLFKSESMLLSIKALAEFHALCIAFDSQSSMKLEQLFPIYDPSKLMWVQKDMVNFLTKVSQSAAGFLETTSNSTELSRLFAENMTSPEVIFQAEFNRSSNWKCLQHGDSWHNNFLLNSDICAIVDWQVAYFGRGPTDLCYLILSSSTLCKRQEHLETWLRTYYDTLIKTTDALGHAFTASFEDLQNEYISAIPYCILFCANAEDFVLDKEEKYLRVANDKEMQQFECDFDVGQLISDDKLLKRIRRRNFLDICKDALSYNVLHKSNENTSVSAKKVDMAETSQPIVEHN